MGIAAPRMAAVLVRPPPPWFWASVTMGSMTTLRGYRWWVRLVAVAALAVGLVVMHAGLDVLACPTASSHPTAAMTASIAPADLPAVDHPAPASTTTQDCGHGMDAVCPAILNSPVGHVLLGLLLASLVVLAGAPATSLFAQFRQRRRRRPWGPPGLALSSLCVLRI